MDTETHPTKEFMRLQWSSSCCWVILLALQHAAFLPATAFQSPGAAAHNSWKIQGARESNASFDVLRVNASATELIADVLMQPLGPILEIPLDDETESYLEQPHAPPSVVLILAGLMVLAVSPLLLQRGLLDFLVAIVYLASLSSMKTLVKLAEENGLDLPLLTTFMHATVTCLCSYCLAKPQWSEAIPAIPVAVAAGSSFLLCNVALLNAGVAFVTMVGCGTPAITFVIQLLRGRIALSTKVVLPILGVICGSLLCVSGESTATVLGLVLSVSAAILRSAKAVLMQDCIANEISAINLAFWMSFWTGAFLLPVTAIQEGPTISDHFQTANSMGIQALVASCCVACCLNISQCFVVKMLGAVQYNVLGNLNLIVVIMIAVSFLHEVVTPIQYIGLVLLASGAIASSQSFQTKKAEQAPEADTAEKVPLINQMCSNSKTYSDIANVQRS